MKSLSRGAAYLLSLGAACTVIPQVAAMSSAPAPELEEHYTGPVSGLAQGCFVLQSPASGLFVQYEPNSGITDGKPAYSVSAESEALASRFYLKPSRQDHFLFRDTDGRYLSGGSASAIRAVDKAEDRSEWSVTSADSGFEFRNAASHLQLAHHTDNGDFYYTGALDLLRYDRETRLNFVAADGCAEFPEVTLNSQGNMEALRGEVSEPVRGYIDAHAHITSYEFMGGKFMAGEPFNRFGVEEALKDSKELHGKDGALDIIGNLYTFDDISHRYDTRGWPDFPWWPNHQQMSHMGYYYKWMERAYQSGLRIIVTNLVENEVLCWAQSNINPASWINPNSCNVMDSIRLQAQRLRELEEYIDAQAGGPGKGFFHVVTSPQEARETIAAGRLAVVMGIEASETFNCGLNDYCTRETIETLLQEVYDLGVRSLYPTHKFDNQLAGSVVEGGFINVGELLSTGRFFETEECDDETTGRHMTDGFPLIGDIDGIREILDAVHLNPEYDESIGHCNQHGLSPLGSYLVNRMIDLKMMVELDHMSNHTATAVMDIAEARGYSGVLSTHSWMLKGKDGAVHYNTQRLIEAGGFTAPYNSDANDMQHRVGRYLDLVELTPYWRGVGIGTDMSGLGGQPGPRSDATERPLEYPFVSEFGIRFDRQISGNRVFDLNTDGIAHYGLLPDFIEDLRQRAPARTYEAVMNSAEAYLQTWERTYQAGVTDHYEPAGLDYSL
jgi:microsomal dipeptidase-like Zn-dependent dipeptidase